MRAFVLSAMLVFGTMAGAVLPGGTAAAQTLQTVTDARLAFTAKLPGTPAKTETPGKDGDILTRITSWTVDATNSAYSVGALEFKAGTISTMDPNLLLGAALDGGIGAISGTETGRKMTTLSGQPAIEATFTATLDGQPIIGRVTFAIRGDNVYSVMTMEPPASSDAIYRQVVRDFKLL